MNRARLHAHAEHLTLGTAGASALAMLVVLFLATCGGGARAYAQDRAPASDAGAPVMAFVVRPDSDDFAVTRLVTVWSRGVLPYEGHPYGYYLVRVLGLGRTRLVHVSAELPVDAQFRDLREQADDAARALCADARVACDSLRPRKPARDFGYLCA